MIEPIDTAPKDGTRILCLCADGRTQYCWWVGCSEAEGLWMTERETTPRAWYVGASLPPEGPAVTHDLAIESESDVYNNIPVATDEELSYLYNSIPMAHRLSLRAIYDLGREHGAQAAEADLTENS